MSELHNNDFMNSLSRQHEVIVNELHLLIKKLPKEAHELFIEKLGNGKLFTRLTLRKKCRNRAVVFALLAWGHGLASIYAPGEMWASIVFATMGYLFAVASMANYETLAAIENPVSTIQNLAAHDNDEL